jgi:hypothetical protein
MFKKDKCEKKTRRDSSLGYNKVILRSNAFFAMSFNVHVLLQSFTFLHVANLSNCIESPPPPKGRDK